MSQKTINSALIANSPMERIPVELKEKIQKKKPFIDIHTHVFTVNDVPPNFLGIRIPMNRRFIGAVSQVAYWMKRGFRKSRSRDETSGIGYFLKTMKGRSSEYNYKRMAKTYYADHPDALFGILTMDMNVGIGRANNSIRSQLGTIAMLRNQFPTKILPYACIDPRRGDEALELFEDAFNTNGYLKYVGLKVYPSLGYLPSHPILMKMYAICEEKGIPVLTHCSSGSTHGSDKKQNSVPGIYVNDKDEYVKNADFKAAMFHKKRDYRDFFNRPQNWAPVLDKFPNLNLNIAHFGGDDAWKEFASTKASNEWVDTIIKFMKEYDHVYADFSYTLYDRKYSRCLKKQMENDPEIMEKVLFGSDYYMLVIEDDYRTILRNFKSDMGPELMERLTVTNPNKHLFGI